MGPETETDAEIEAALHAFVDGRLAPAEQARIEAWLADHPDDAARVHAYRLLNARLHEAYDPVLDEAVPPTMAALVAGGVRRAGARAAGSAGGWLRYAAAVALLLAGAAGGWAARGTLAPTVPLQTGAFAAQAIGAHRVFVSEVRHPVEVPATDEAHLVTWLSKRLGTPLRAPDLQKSGFGLVGGRLLADGERPAAQFMYEDASGRRATVYVRGAGGGDVSFRYAASDGVSAFYWVDRAFAYALVAPLDKPGLMAIANKVYRDLEAR